MKVARAMRMPVNAERKSIKKILVVDSDQAMTEILRANLGRSNIRVISARSAAQALAKASMGKPDLILLNVGLEGGAGLEVCQELKMSQKTNKIPVIMIGGKSENKYVSAGIVAGAEDYVPCPADPSDVVALVEEHFRRTERKRTANPVTKLPGSSSIYRKVGTLIEEGRPFAVMYVDLVSSEAYGKETGRVTHYQAMRIVAAATTDAIRLFGNEDDLVGHLDNESFVVITTPARAENLCRKIIDSFDTEMGYLALRQLSVCKIGYADDKSQLSRSEKSGPMSLSIAVVTNERRRIGSQFELTRMGDQLRKYVRSLPGSNYCIDRREDDASIQSEKGTERFPGGYRNDVRIMQKALSRISLLCKALIPAVTLVETPVHSLSTGRIDNLDSRQLGNLELIRGRTSQLLSVLRALESLGGAEWATSDAFSRKANLKELVDLSVGMVRGLADERHVRIYIEKCEISREPLTDEQSLLQILFYLLRSEIESSQRGGRVSIGVSKETRNFVAVQITNLKHYIPPKELASLLKPEPDSTGGGERVNDLRWATALAEAVGGVLRVSSTKEDGTALTLLVPKRWSSHVTRINRLQSERERSGKAARNQLDSVRNLILLTRAQVPAALDEGLHELDYKVRELEVLCNLGLLLADEFASDLERQQDKITELNAYHDDVLNVLLELLRQIARSHGAGDLFDPDSGRLVARYALIIGSELKLDRDQLLSLHYAALLNDLGLAFAPPEAFGLLEGLTDAGRSKLKQRLFNIQELLSRLRFLTTALSLLSNKYERYDGSGYPHGLRGDEIPPGARILAVAEHFAKMPWGLVSIGGLDPESVAKEIATDLAQRFDTRVVNALIKSLRKGKLSIQEEVTAQ